jgi:hypothetical protein
MPGEAQMKPDAADNGLDERSRNRRMTKESNHRNHISYLCQDQAIRKNYYKSGNGTTIAAIHF